MIIFLNENSSTVYVYGVDGVKVIDFDNVDEIENILGTKKAYYVTNVKEVFANDIMDLVNRLNGNPNRAKQPQDTVFYLQSKATGPVFISDLNITFMGPDDAKEIDKELHSKVMDSVVVQAMIKKGDLAVVPKKTMVKFIEKYQKSRSKKQAATVSAQDHQLDSILVDPSVNAEDATAMSSGMFPDDGIEDIDITDEVKRAGEI